MPSIGKGGGIARTPMQVLLLGLPRNFPVLQQAQTRGPVQLQAVQLPLRRIRMLCCRGYPFLGRALEGRSQSGHALGLHLQPSVREIKPAGGRECYLDAHCKFAYLFS